MDFFLWPGRVLVGLAIECFAVMYGLYLEALYGRHLREAVIYATEG